MEGSARSSAHTTLSVYWGTHLFLSNPALSSLFLSRYAPSFLLTHLQQILLLVLQPPCNVRQQLAGKAGGKRGALQDGGGPAV